MGVLRRYCLGCKSLRSDGLIQLAIDYSCLQVFEVGRARIELLGVSKLVLLFLLRTFISRECSCLASLISIFNHKGYSLLAFYKDRLTHMILDSSW